MCIYVYVYVYGDEERELYKAMAFASLEGEFLLIHSLSIKVRQGVSGAAKGGVHSPINLIEARRYRLPFLPHISRFPLSCDRQGFSVAFWRSMKRENFHLFILFKLFFYFVVCGWRFERKLASFLYMFLMRWWLKQEAWETHHGNACGRVGPLI